MARFAAEVLLQASESGTWEKVVQSVYKRSSCSGRFCGESEGEQQGRGLGEDAEKIRLQVAQGRVAELEMEKEELHREDFLSKRSRVGCDRWSS